MKIPYKNLVAGMVLTTSRGSYTVLAGTEEMNVYLSRNGFTNHRGTQGILVCQAEVYEGYKNLSVYEKYFNGLNTTMVDYKHVITVGTENKAFKNVLRRD